MLVNLRFLLVPERLATSERLGLENRRLVSTTVFETLHSQLPESSGLGNFHLLRDPTAPGFEIVCPKTQKDQHTALPESEILDL